MKAFFLLLLFFFIELGYFRIADYFNIIDKPNHRSLHNKVTIRGGGIIFFISTTLFFVNYNFAYSFFLLGVSFVSIISFLDDVFTLPNHYRLLFHLFAISMIVIQLSIYNHSLFLVGFYLFIGIGVVNAYNFMDGINGMTGGYSLVIFLSLWIINNKFEAFIENDFLLFMILSIIVFVFFNFRKNALCFAGDVGSISMGVILLFLITKGTIVYKNPTLFLFLAVYGVDTALTILFRLKNKENIFQAHKSHLFQIIVSQKKVPHLIVSGIYSIIQFSICWIIIANLGRPMIIQYYISASIIVALIITYLTVRFRILNSHI